MRIIITSIILFYSFVGISQSFSPAVGQSGTTAIYKDSSIIDYWADAPVIQRGWLDIANKSQGYVTHGEAAFAGGVAEGDGVNVVSLGDSGIALYSLSNPIVDAVGFDFAVFENGFADNYMEFAFVEVSSDGQHFFRFPATSETPTNIQLTNFTYGDCRMVNNLAGKYRQGYGTPFDLAELSGNVGLDLQSISYVRLIDVIGSVGTFASLDQFGTPINDPYPTVFASGGFDLDGLAVIHAQVAGLQEQNHEVVCYPNPVKEVLYFSEAVSEVELINLQGKQLVFAANCDSIEIGSLPSGIYLLRFYSKGIENVQRILKE